MKEKEMEQQARPFVDTTNDDITLHSRDERLTSQKKAATSLVSRVRRVAQEFVATK
jgi:hypothetical protein